MSHSPATIVVMRHLLLPLLLLCGCGPADSLAGPDTVAALNPPTAVGRLEDRLIDEASDLARSGRSDDLYWTVNDDGDGNALLFAIDSRGTALGRVKVAGARQVDWEGLASFTLDGTAYLVVADIGDNMAWRDRVQAYVVPEPDPGDSSVRIAWTMAFGYDGGPRDAESIAVDVENERLLILSKREIPAVLFEYPLRPGSGAAGKAMPIAVPRLPQPTGEDIRLAPARQDWWWQPTAMDFSPQENGAIILTYRGVYFYPRQAGEGWENALQRQPQVLSRGDFNLAESAAFDAAGSAIFVTFEGRGAPVVRIDLGEALEK